MKFGNRLIQCVYWSSLWGFVLNWDGADAIASQILLQLQAVFEKMTIFAMLYLTQ